MKKSFLSTTRIVIVLFVAMLVVFAFSACKEEEAPKATQAPTEAPAVATFKPVVEITYNANEFIVEDTTIIEYIGEGGDVTIPEKITAIGDMAFSGRSDVTSITFTKDIVSVGEKAFENCTGLSESFIPPQNLAYIGDYAFAGCTGITTIEIQNKPLTVGTHIFEGCTSLQKVIIPKTMVTVPDYAFSGCTSLSEVILDKEIEGIGSYAFEGCTSLVNITIPAKTISIGDYAFKGCNKLENFTYENNKALESVGLYAFNDTAWFKTQIDTQKKAEQTEPADSVNVDVNKYVMVGRDIIIYYIDESDANAKIELNIPEKAYVIASGAFTHCANKIIAVNFTTGSNMVDICDGAFEGASSLKAFKLPTKLTVINDNVFNGCSNITTFEIASKLTSIGNNAFKGCEKITSIYLPDDITSIGDNAFYGCKGLTEVTLPDSITDLGDYAFKNCENITKFVIPLKLANVGVQAFDNTKWYNNLSVYDKAPTENQFHIFGDGVLIKADIVNNASIVIPEEVKSIAAFTFADWGTIKDRAFYNSSLPKSITIPDGVTSIGDYAFYFCENLETVVISESVTNIGEKAFYGCKNLKVINIPDNITEIKDYAFYGCSALPEIKLPSKLTTVGAYAFYDCYNLTNIVIPQTVTKIGSFAFTNTSWFHYNTDEEMIVGNGILLKSNSPESNVVLSDNVKSIVGGAFESGDIDSITLPASVTYLPEYAFSGCINLTKVTAKGNLTSVAARAFNGCNKITEFNPGSAKLANNAYENSSLSK